VRTARRGDSINCGRSWTCFTAALPKQWPNIVENRYLVINHHFILNQTVSEIARSAFVSVKREHLAALSVLGPLAELLLEVSLCPPAPFMTRGPSV
jgi:hypothetical protein